MMTVVHADFNNDGYDDMAIGVPYEDIGSIEDAGAVNVMYGSSTGFSVATDQIWDQNTPGVIGAAEEGDRFGESVAAGDFNDDGFDDLAIGVPFEDIGNTQDAGAVNILYGSSSGLRTQGNQLWYQDLTDIEGRSEAGDRFGEVVAVGDFNRDGIDDLAIGVPMEDIGSKADAGAVSILYGSAAGITANGNAIWHQDSLNIRGAAEVGDRFGRSLSVGDFDGDQYDDLAIGIPMEDIGTISDAGAVNVMYGAPGGLSWVGNDLWYQSNSGIYGSPEQGDRFGLSLAAGDFNQDGRDDLAVGVPHEDVSTIRDAGGVNVIYGTSAGLSGNGDRFFSQYRAAVEDTAEDRDQFGFSLASADFNADGYADLAIGVPGEDLGPHRDAGAVSVLYGDERGISTVGDGLWHQGVTGSAGVAEAGDRFGMGLAVGDIDRDGDADLIVGVPFEDVGSIPDAGAIHLIRGSESGLMNTGDQLITQRTAGVAGAAEPNDQMGHFGGATSISEFHIDINFTDFGLTTSQQQVFVDAARRWSEIILGDLPDANVFSIGIVDDLWINVRTVDIDGPGDTLGRAAPTAFRTGSNLPTYGFMEFDKADVDTLEANGGLYDLILHEMGHVLGVGTLWRTFSLVTGVGTSNPTYTGSNAVAEYNDIFNNSSTSVPVANTGGSGTRNVHWRESVLGSELMTGYLSSNGTAALSRITVGSLLDLGYQADLDAADIFAQGGSGTAGALAGAISGFGSSAVQLTLATDGADSTKETRKVPSDEARASSSDFVLASWNAEVQRREHDSFRHARTEDVDSLYLELGDADETSSWL